MTQRFNLTLTALFFVIGFNAYAAQTLMRLDKASATSTTHASSVSSSKSDGSLFTSLIFSSSSNVGSFDTGGIGELSRGARASYSGSVSPGTSASVALGGGTPWSISGVSCTNHGFFYTCCGQADSAPKSASGTLYFTAVEHGDTNCSDFQYANLSAPATIGSSACANVMAAAHQCVRFVYMTGGTTIISGSTPQAL